MTLGLFKGCDLFYPSVGSRGERRNCASCADWGGDACNEEELIRDLYVIKPKPILGQPEPSIREIKALHAVKLQEEEFTWLH